MPKNDFWNPNLKRGAVCSTLMLNFPPENIHKALSYVLTSLSQSARLPDMDTINGPLDEDEHKMGLKAQHLQMLHANIMSAFEEVIPSYDSLSSFVKLMFGWKSFSTCSTPIS